MRATHVAVWLFQGALLPLPCHGMDAIVARRSGTAPRKLFATFHGGLDGTLALESVSVTTRRMPGCHQAAESNFCIIIGVSRCARSTGQLQGPFRSGPRAVGGFWLGASVLERCEHFDFDRLVWTGGSNLSSSSTFQQPRWSGTDGTGKGVDGQCCEGGIWPGVAIFALTWSTSQRPCIRARASSVVDQYAVVLGIVQQELQHVLSGPR